VRGSIQSVRALNYVASSGVGEAVANADTI